MRPLMVAVERMRRMLAMIVGMLRVTFRKLFFHCSCAAMVLPCYSDEGTIEVTSDDDVVEVPSKM